ncbi:unnamed protein product [Citrullus colocynthis]|uniref:AIPP2-like SPOC-like domain-containing protein n=1 Tax=Citrullus colocynthis TaxID=252529 RepID=A0ABP0XZ80_9ROSI
MAGEFYDGILAKPPCVVCGRVYELTRKNPPILQVKLLRRSDIWDDLFHDECPDVVNMLNAEYLLFGVFHEIEDDQSPFPMLEYGPAVSSVECDSRVPLLEFTPNGYGKQDLDNAVKREIDIKGGNTAGKSPTANDVDSTIQRLLLEFGSQEPRESNVNALNMNAQTKDQEPAPIAATNSYSRSLSKVKTEPSVIKAEGSDGNKCLQTEHCSRMVPTSFSIDGSQNMSGLTEQDAPKRVAEKYLQIFNAGIKKKRRFELNLPFVNACVEDVFNKAGGTNLFCPLKMEFFWQIRMCSGNKFVKALLRI